MKTKLFEIRGNSSNEISITILQGKFAGVEFVVYDIDADDEIAEDGKCTLTYSYDIISTGDVLQYEQDPEFENTISDILIQLIDHAVQYVSSDSNSEQPSS